LSVVLCTVSDDSQCQVTFFSIASLLLLNHCLYVGHHFLEWLKKDSLRRSDGRKISIEACLFGRSLSHYKRVYIL
jgi:hypothetical protein